MQGRAPHIAVSFTLSHFSRGASLLYIREGVEGGVIPLRSGMITDRKGGGVYRFSDIAFVIRRANGLRVVWSYRFP